MRKIDYLAVDVRNSHLNVLGRLENERKTANVSLENILRVIPDDVVIIYYWKPSKLGSTGHVSLRTSKIYASLWPKQRPEINSGYTERGILQQSYQEDVVEEARDGTRETGEADDKVEIKDLDVEEINLRFTSFQEEVNRGNIQWSLLSHQWIDKCYPNKIMQNCSGLVAELLTAGEINKIIPDFQSPAKNYLMVYLMSKQIQLLSIVPAPLIIISRNATFIQLVMITASLPLMIGFRILDRHKLHAFELNSDAIGALFAIPSGLVPFIYMLPLLSSFLILPDVSSFSRFLATTWRDIGIIITIYGTGWLGLTIGGKLGDFLSRCCFHGTDGLIRPDGIIRLAKYAQQLSKISVDVRKRVNYFHAHAYLTKSGSAVGAILIAMLVGSYSGSLIGLNIGILFGMIIDYGEQRQWKNTFRYRLKNSRDGDSDSDSDEEEGPDQEEARESYEFFLNSIDDTSYNPVFSTLTSLGMAWGILTVSLLNNDESLYFAVIMAGSGLMGFLVLGGLYKLIKYAYEQRNLPEGTIENFREKLVALVASKEDLYRQIKRDIENVDLEKKLENTLKQISRVKNLLLSMEDEKINGQKHLVPRDTSFPKSPKATIQRKADETKKPLLQKHKVSISQFAAEGGSIYSSVDMKAFPTSNQKSEDEESQENIQNYQRYSKCFCLIL